MFKKIIILSLIIFYIATSYTFTLAKELNTSSGKYTFPDTNDFGADIIYPDNVNFDELRKKESDVDKTNYINEQLGNLQSIENVAYYILKYGDEGLKEDVMPDSCLITFYNTLNNQEAIDNQEAGTQGYRSEALKIIGNYVVVGNGGTAIGRKGKVEEPSKENVSEEDKKAAEEAWKNYEKNYKDKYFTDLTEEERFEKVKEMRALADIMSKAKENEKAQIIRTHATDVENKAAEDIDIREEEYREPDLLIGKGSKEHSVDEIISEAKSWDESTRLYNS